MSEQSNREAHYQKLMTNALGQLKTLQARLSEQERRQQEPIAIVGIGCRYPGGINSPEDFWQALMDRKDCIVDASHRWNMQKFYDPDPMAPGKIYSRHLGLVDHMAEFDADFFGISPREAECMDPQQRILLETSWHALEDAGYHMQQLRGLKMGVYVGIGTFDYAFLRSHAGGLESISTYDGTGTAFSIAAGRVAYVFGLEGPAMAIETACSSSLVATHLAIQALRNGEINAALAGGVNSISNPATSVMFSKGMMLSPDGRCRAFDRNGNGYVRSEGCGVVILKRLSDALRDGNTITAVIRGSAINQDGRSQGIVAPNENAQREVILAALANARLRPDQIDYVEAHGTGTALGDPIEVNALASVFKQGEPRKHKLRIGSVKTNIGHCETAAGVAGIIKVALALKHGVQPAQLHFSEPNPYIPWPNIPISVASEPQEWTHPDRTAGVSSFGFSGTNAHLVMQAAPVQQPQSTNIDPSRRWPLTLSAQSAAALNMLIDRYLAADIDDNAFTDWCYSSNRNRGQMEHRLTVLAKDIDEARSHLTAARQGEKTPYWQKNICTYRKPAVVFVFAGQGPQFEGMGKALYDNIPVFKHHIDACEAHLSTLWPVKLTDLLWGDQQHQLNQTRYTQAALFSLQTACAQWWMQMGVEPKRLLGHSFGEYAAAFMAGVFSLQDALTLLVARGGLPQEHSAPGAMLSIQAGRNTVDSWMDAHREQLNYAAVNSSETVVVSGTEDAIAALEQQCANAQIECQRLRVSHAFHSPLMEPVLDRFRAIAEQCTFHKPVKPLISCLTGQLAQDEIARADYWVDHLRHTVQFDQAVKTLHKAKPEVVLEMGPGSTILGLVRQHLEADNLLYLPSFRQQQDALETLTHSAVQAHHRGLIKDWLALYPAGTRYCNTLPHYPFQRRIFWFKVDSQHSSELLYAFAQYAASNPVTTSQQAEQMSSTSHQVATQAAHTALLKHKLFSQYLQHPLLDRIIGDVPLDSARLPLLKEYKLFGEPVAARGFLLAVLFAALHHHDRQTGWTLDNIHFPTLLHLQDQPATLHVILTLQHDIFEAELILQHDTGKKILLTASAQKTSGGATEEDRVAEPEQFRLKADGLMERKRFHEQLNEQHHVFLGTEFQWLDSVWHQQRRLLANLAMPSGVQADDTFVVHPGLIESIFQAVFAHPQWTRGLALAQRIERVTWYRRGASARLNLMLDWQQTQNGDATLLAQVNDQQGKRVLELRGVALEHVDHTTFLRQLGNHPAGRHYQTQWIPAPPPEHAAEPIGHLLVIVPPSSLRKPLPYWLADLALQADSVRTWLNGPDADATEPADGWQSLGAITALDLSNDTALHETQIHWPQNDPLPTTILYLAAPGDDVNPVAITQQLRALLQLAQGHAHWPVPPSRYLLVTQQGEQADPHAAALWGMGQCWQLELPHSNLSLIDLDRAAAEQPAFWRSQLPLPAHGERQWHVRGNQLLVPRLQPVDISDTPCPIACDAHADYLITGGLGALGQFTAQWLIDNGARHLTLMGRSDPTEAVRQQIETWRGQGVAVRLYQGDVSRDEDVSALFASFAANVPLKGIFHCAGMVADKLMIQQPWPVFASVLPAKIDGTWWLHQASRNLPLDYFVCYSSSAAVLGNPGQANYAAANAFMNSIMQDRRAQGLAAQSIHWGPWADAGMTAQLESSHRQHFRKRGITPLPQEQALASFSQLLKQNAHDVMVLDIAWEQALQDWPLAIDKGLLCEIASQISLALNYKKLNHQLIQMIRQQTPDEREKLVLRYMETELCQVLNSSELDCDQSVMSMGIDSLMAMEFRSRLKSEMALDIPVAELLRGPSVRELSALVSTQFTDEYFARVESGGEQSGNVPTDDILQTAQWKQQQAKRNDSETSHQEIEI